MARKDVYKGLVQEGFIYRFDPGMLTITATRDWFFDIFLYYFHDGFE
jgi:hypothetical protein